MHWKNQRSLAGIWSLPFHTVEGLLIQGDQHPGPGRARRRAPHPASPQHAQGHTHCRLLPCTAFISLVGGAGLICARLLAEKEEDTAEQERSQWRECSDILTGCQGCGGELARSEQVLLVGTGTIPGGKSPFLAGVWMSQTAGVSFANKLG